LHDDGEELSPFYVLSFYAIIAVEILYCLLTKIKKMLKYRKGKKIVVCAMRAKMHVSNPGRHRGYAEPSGVTGVAFFIPMLEVGKK